MFNCIKVIQIFFDRHKGRKAVGDSYTWPVNKTCADSYSISEIRADRSNDMRAALVAFTKQRPSTNTMYGHTVNGVLLKMGEVVTYWAGEEARCKNVVGDNFWIPKPANFGPYGDFSAKIPQGKALGGELKARFIEED